MEKTILVLNEIEKKSPLKRIFRITETFFLLLFKYLSNFRLRKG